MKKPPEFHCKAICPVATDRKNLWMLKNASRQWNHPDDFQPISEGASQESVFLFASYLEKLVGIQMDGGDTLFSGEIPAEHVALCRLPAAIAEVTNGVSGSGSYVLHCPYMKKRIDTVVFARPT